MKLSPGTAWIVVALSSLSSAVATAQPQAAAVLDGDELFVEDSRILYTLVGEAPNSEFGWVARVVGDVDGDEVLDFVSTAPSFGGGRGRIYVYSGKEGKLLFQQTGQPGERLGNGASTAGDVNGDGTRDVIIGAPNGTTRGGPGHAYVYSGKDGALLHTLTAGNSGDSFGYKVCGLGDVDGDERDDLLVTALNGSGEVKGSGLCYGYSGDTGELLFVLDGERAGDKFGSAACGSMDPDHPLLAVGAQDAGPGKRGRVYVYELWSLEPELRFTIEPLQTSVNLGQMFLSFPGDLDGDEVPDVYASDWGDSTRAQGGGRVLVCSGEDGSKLLELFGSQPGEGLGTSPSDAGDVDGDGKGDLAVGAWQHASGAPSGGKVTLFSGADGREMMSWTCRQPNDTFGFDATGLGDVDGDGGIDLLLTSAWSPAKGPKTGRVFVIAGPTPKQIRQR